MSLSVPTGFAKIYPDDFLVPSRAPAEEAETGESVEFTIPQFIPSAIGEDAMTRAEFVDAIASRLYGWMNRASCFGEIASSVPVRYTLLFTDVSVGEPYASSVCLAMHNGLVRGYADGTFRPDQTITAAEAAAVLSRLALSPRAAKAKEEVWYNRYMEAMRGVDREFTMRAGDPITGPYLAHSLCILKQWTPVLDPLGEFNRC